MLNLSCRNGFFTLNAKIRVSYNTVIGVDINTEIFKFANRRRIEGMHFFIRDIKYLDEVTALLIYILIDKFDVILYRKMFYNIY